MNKITDRIKIFYTILIIYILILNKKLILISKKDILGLFLFILFICTIVTMVIIVLSQLIIRHNNNDFKNNFPIFADKTVNDLYIIKYDDSINGIVLNYITSCEVIVLDYNKEGIAKLFITNGISNDDNYIYDIDNYVVYTKFPSDYNIPDNSILNLQFIEVFYFVEMDRDNELNINLKDVDISYSDIRGNLNRGNYKLKRKTIIPLAILSNTIPINDINTLENGNIISNNLILFKNELKDNIPEFYERYNF